MIERRLLDVIIGVYVSILVVATSALVQWESVASTFSVGVAVALGVGIAAVVALVVSTIEDLANTVASVPVAALTVGLPLVFFPYLIFVAEPASTQALVAAAGLAAVIPGAAVPAGGTMLTNRRQREAATEITVVTVGDDDASEWWTRLQLGGGLLVGTGIMIMVLGMISGFLDGGTSLITTLGGLITTVASLLGDDSTELAVTDTGLGIDWRFTRWESFEGFRVTDDNIELHRPEWYHTTQSYDREEITDEETLLEGLGRYLPRLDEDGKRTDTTAETTPVGEYSQN